MSMSEIQKKLKAPKCQFNNFGKYNYRSCEDIVEAVKPVLAEFNYHLNMTDDVVGVGERVYIKATCTVMDGDKLVAVSSALAREAVTKKGMDDSQITGTASSYARKYALNGLFAIDDTKDADTPEHQELTKFTQKDVDNCLEAMKQCVDLNQLKEIFLPAYNLASEQQKKTLTSVKNAKKSLLEKTA